MTRRLKLGFLDKETFFANGMHIEPNQAGTPNLMLCGVAHILSPTAKRPMSFSYLGLMVKFFQSQSMGFTLNLASREG